MLQKLVVFHGESMEKTFVFLFKACFQCSYTICKCLFLQLLLEVSGFTISLTAGSLLICCPLSLSRHPNPTSRTCYHGVIRAGRCADAAGGHRVRDQSERIRWIQGPSKHAEQIGLAFWMPLLCHSLDAILGSLSVKQVLFTVIFWLWQPLVWPALCVADLPHLVELLLEALLKMKYCPAVLNSNVNYH